jgi:hypothetical protein
MTEYRQIKIFEGITRNVFILGLVSLFTDLSSQMVFPLIPLFLITVLGTGAYAVGIVEGAAETTASLLKVVSGYWSDKSFCKSIRKNWQRLENCSTRCDCGGIQ